jgi:hypothetical protein
MILPGPKIANVTSGAGAIELELTDTEGSEELTGTTEDDAVTEEIEVVWQPANRAARLTKLATRLFFFMDIILL